MIITLRHLTAIAVSASLLISCRNGEGSAPGQKESLGTVETYVYAASVIPSVRYSVKVNGENQTVISTTEPDFCVFGAGGKVKVEIASYEEHIKSAVVRPLNKNPEYEVENDRITLYMQPYDRFVVEINGSEDGALFVFANPVEQKPADRSNYKYFETGKVYDAGQISLASGQKVYIEGGAIVKGAVSCTGQKNVGLEGCGILDNGDSDQKTVFFNKCDGVSLKNVLVRNRNAWTTFIADSQNIDADGYKVIATFSDKADGSGNENDAFDLMGVAHARIKHGFSYCHDDAFCIKSRKWTYGAENHDIVFEDCIAWNHGSGNSFEIGYELQENVYDIHFKDIFSIHSAGRAEYRRGAIGIHNGAGGKISDISYENVWLEDPKEYGIYMTIIQSNYNIGNDVTWAPGYMENISFKNVHIGKTAYGNFAKGYDSATHALKNIRFEDLFIEGKKAVNATEAGFKTLTNADISFK